MYDKIPTKQTPGKLLNAGKHVPENNPGVEYMEKKSKPRKGWKKRVTKEYMDALIKTDEPPSEYKPSLRKFCNSPFEHRWIGFSCQEIMAEISRENSITINIADTFGLDHDKIKTYRMVPVRIYLDSAEGHKSVDFSVKAFLSEYGLEPLEEEDPEIGSWFKKFIAFTKDKKTKEELTDTFQKGKHALELGHIQLVQSEVDKNKTEAVKNLADALKDQSFAAIQIGSILMVKYLDDNGDSVLSVRSLTTNEMILLENNPDLLKYPDKVLDLFQKGNQVMQLAPKAEGRQA